MRTSTWATASNYPCEAPLSSKPIRRILRLGTLLVGVCAGLLLGHAAARGLLAQPFGSSGQGSSGPIAVLPRTEHDFGAVSEDRLLRISLPVHNVGDRRLVIVEQSCAECGMSQDEPNTIVVPGQTALLDVSFDTRGLHGSVQHVADFNTNDRRLPHIRVVLKANVKRLP